MAPIITVHRGELLQIERMIDQGKGKEGLGGYMFGLRTESRQPVIQFVCSQSKGYDSIKDVLQKGHGLLKLGEWIVSRSQNSKFRTDSNNILTFYKKIFVAMTSRLICC